MATAIQLFKEKNEYMSEFYPEVSAAEIYSDIFPLEDIEKKGDKSYRASNPIFSYKQKSEDGRVYYHNEIVFSDCFEESIAKTYKNDCALCSMISYSGRKKSAKNAYKCHGFIIDLDGVGMSELRSFWGWVEDLKRIPYPTYVASSGHGLHIYYVFENPVPLYPQVAQNLQRLKRGLTMWVWNKETSNYKVKERQYQGIYQGFRMVGSCTKLGKGKARGKYLVKAWKTGKPVSITYLNHFVEDEWKCPENPDYSSWDWAEGEHYSLEECRKLYPDWYERVIIKNEPSGQWKCNRHLYDWWLRKITNNPWEKVDHFQGGEIQKIRDGNRYHCVSMLYVFGIKCMIAKELIDADALNLIEIFNDLTEREDNEFTESDVRAASKFYDTKYAKVSRNEISRRTGILIEPSVPRRKKGKRLKQTEHLEEARAIRDIRMKRQGKTWQANGRPKGSKNKECKKRDMVLEYAAAYPEANVTDIAKALGISRTTVYKYLGN